MVIEKEMSWNFWHNRLCNHGKKDFALKYPFQSSLIQQYFGELNEINVNFDHLVC